MHFFSLDIYAGRYRDFLEMIQNPLKKTLVFTPNPEILVLASRERGYMDTLEKADHLTPDANGLYVGALLGEGHSYLSAFWKTLTTRQELREKYGDLIKGSDLTRDLFDSAEKQGRAILIIDNYRIVEPENGFEVRKKRVQEELPALLKERYPKLVAYVLFDGDISPSEIATYILEHDIEYVFSSIGMRKQEERLVEVFSHLPRETPVLGLGVGASIDYLLGLQRRAPRILQYLGLEWLYRLIREPRKHWRRIYTVLIDFPIIMRKEK